MYGTTPVSLRNGCTLERVIARSRSDEAISLSTCTF